MILFVFHLSLEHLRQAKKIYLCLVAGRASEDGEREALPDMTSVLQGKEMPVENYDEDGEEEDDEKMGGVEGEETGAGGGGGGETRTTALFSLPDKSQRMKRRGKLGKRERVSVKSKEWILRKKERQTRQGKAVPNSSKYTGRRRGPKF